MSSDNEKTQYSYSPTSTYSADAGKSANALFNAGSGYTPFTGHVLAPLNGYTTQALNQTRSIAQQPIPGLDSAFGFANGMMANNGMTGDLSRISGILEGYTGNNGLTSDMSANAGVLQGIASGDQIEDPRLAAMLETNANRATNGAATRFGGGRYGSAAIGQGVGQAVADANNATMLQSNENARGRQLQAAGLLDNIYQSGANRALTAANAAGNIYENGLGRAAGAAAMLPTLNNLRYDGASRLAGIGDFYDQRAQAEKDASIKQYEAQQMQDWSRLGAFANILSGVAPSSGSITTASGSKPSAAQGILGGAMAGGATLGPWGALAGGILGGFA